MPSDDPYSSYLEEQYKRVEHDLEEAAIFLASIIPREDKTKIHADIESDPEWGPKQHFFIGMTTRNALRRAGFFYDPTVMDNTWFEILEKAVGLPEEKIILTASIQERIQKYRVETEEYNKRMKESKKKNQKKLHRMEGFLGSLLARLRRDLAS